MFVCIDCLLSWVDAKDVSSALHYTPLTSIISQTLAVRSLPFARRKRKTHLLNTPVESNKILIMGEFSEIASSVGYLQQEAGVEWSGIELCTRTEATLRVDVCCHGSPMLGCQGDPRLDASLVGTGHVSCSHGVDSHCFTCRDPLHLNPRTP